MPHQALVLQDSHKRVGVFGAYGCGKTFATYQADEKHMIITPNGETLIGADTLIQLDNTIRKDIEGDFPAEFVKRYNRQKNKIELINGHILHYKHLADEGDIRSYNLTRAHILEASETKHESYIQLQTRLRNEAAMIPELNEEGAPIYDYNHVQKRYVKRIKYDWTQFIIESNPDSGWIKDDVLMRSAEIILHNLPDQEYYPTLENVFDFMSSHIMPTKANYMLNPTFYDDMRAGKPEWWVKRYLEGSFQYAEGLVYPNAAGNIIPSFTIPKSWQRIIGFDYGLNDNSHFVFGAIDWFGEYFKNGKPAVFWFAEVVRNNMNVQQLAVDYKRMYRQVVPTGSLYCTPLMDAKSYGQRTKTNEKKTIGTLFAEQGCLFNPAQMNLDARIFRGNAMVDNKQEFFFEDGVPRLIEEMKNYKYPEKKIMGDKSSYKPIDKNNHGVNAREFALMALPRNMKPSFENPMKNYFQDVDTKAYRINPFAERKDEKQDDYEGFAGAFHY
jgi:hypothetical protein